MKSFLPVTKRELQHVSRITVRKEFLQEHTLYSDRPDLLLMLSVSWFFDFVFFFAADWME